MARFRNIPVQAFEQTRAKGGRLLFVYIPVKFRVYRDLVDAPAGAEWVEWTIDESLPRRVERTVADISPEIDYLDLTDPFLAAGRTGQMVYLADDTHWSPEGHRVAAEAIAARLSKRR